MANLVDRNEVYIGHGKTSDGYNDYIRMVSLGTLLCLIPEEVWQKARALTCDVCRIKDGDPEQSLLNWDLDETVVVNYLPHDESKNES